MKQITSILLFIITFTLLVMLFLKPKGKPIAISQTIIKIDYADYLLAIEHIAHYESYSKYPYKYKVKWYVGYGVETSDSITPISKERALEGLKTAFHQKLAIANKRYDVNSNKCLAVGLLMYRFGEGNLAKTKLHKHLLNNNTDSIRIEWSDINVFQGKPHKKINERMEFELSMYFINSFNN